MANTLNKYSKTVLMRCVQNKVFHNDPYLLEVKGTFFKMQYLIIFTFFVRKSVIELKCVMWPKANQCRDWEPEISERSKFSIIVLWLFSIFKIYLHCSTRWPICPNMPRTEGCLPRSLVSKPGKSWANLDESVTQSINPHLADWSF